MKLKASATCKGIPERETLLDRMRLLGIRPTIDGLNVLIEIDVPEGTWPYYTANMIDTIFAAFEDVGHHSVEFNP